MRGGLERRTRKYVKLTTAPLGHSYYYNSETKQSTYKRPTLSTPPNQRSSQDSHVQQPFPPFDNGGGWTGHFGGAVPGQSFPRFDSGDHHFGNQGEHRGRRDFNGRFDQSRGGRRRHDDRPKHRQELPGCAPWILVRTRLSRRFFYNPEQKQSFWKAPEEIREGVEAFDHKEIELSERSGTLHGEVPEAVILAEHQAAKSGSTNKSIPPVPHVPSREGDEDDSDDYEEVEVTDDEGQDGEENPSKRQKIGEENQGQPIEFNEDDIAYQLAAMGQEHGLDPGEYGEGEEDEWEEGAEGLPLTEDDSQALFMDMLDDLGINPFRPWDKIVEDGTLVEDQRYTVLPNMKARREVYDDWSREKIRKLKEEREKEIKEDPHIPYLAFLEKNATPKLYWPEFRRKYKKNSEMRDPKLSDKEREKLYRDLISRRKLPESTLKSDLTALLKSIPVSALNSSSDPSFLPSAVLVDIRYISLPSSIRDPLVAEHISKLPHPSADSDEKLLEDQGDPLEKRQERQRRERALEEREKLVATERRRQKVALTRGRGMLREEEEEIRQAMDVGKAGLMAQLDHIGPK